MQMWGARATFFVTEGCRSWAGRGELAAVAHKPAIWFGFWAISFIFMSWIISLFVLNPPPTHTYIPMPPNLGLCCLVPRLGFQVLPPPRQSPLGASPAAAVNRPHRAVCSFPVRGLFYIYKDIDKHLPLPPTTALGVSGLWERGGSGQTNHPPHQQFPRLGPSSHSAQELSRPHTKVGLCLLVTRCLPAGQSLSRRKRHCCFSWFHLSGLHSGGQGQGRTKGWPYVASLPFCAPFWI